ncbi:uncharacterized protein LOC124242579 [Equus quagga]|uniref:uncharacterized protein LOC124242579 n=1 Tax=Equus quagga TaxID=89248 RepID=UPI001EE206D7|nr:uncharacterized protein LOC124242579 [Equus quagga]
MEQLGGVGSAPLPLALAAAVRAGAVAAARPGLWRRGFPASGAGSSAVPQPPSIQAAKNDHSREGVCILGPPGPSKAGQNCGGEGGGRGPLYPRSRELAHSRFRRFYHQETRRFATRTGSFLGAEGTSTSGTRTTTRRQLQPVRPSSNADLGSSTPSKPVPPLHSNNIWILSVWVPMVTSGLRTASAQIRNLLKEGLPSDSSRLQGSSAGARAGRPAECSRPLGRLREPPREQAEQPSCPREEFQAGERRDKP